MPKPVPVKIRNARQPTPRHIPKDDSRDESAIWLQLWSLSVGASAIAMAAVILPTGSERLGTAAVLLSAAALIAIVQVVTAERHDV